MEENRPQQPESTWPVPPLPQLQRYETKKQELIYGLLIALAALTLSNFVISGGFRLGFAIGFCLCVLTGCGYLWISGRKPSAYSSFLLLISLVIAAGFARSGDGFVKFVMMGFLFVSVNLGLTLQAGQQRHNPGSFAAIGDAFYTAFIHGFRVNPVFRGLRDAFRSGGNAARKGGAIFTGLLIAVPVLIVMILLLIRADAAFEGLMDKLPEIEFGEIFATVFFGGILACLLYTKGVSLRRSQEEKPGKKAKKGINALTVHTVLIAVCLVYLVYLLSQLAYFVGGFAGILPEEYTLAEYARRGFFEMAWLCAINLGVIAISAAVVEKKNGLPVLTKVLCLFISLITVFFVAAASGKMFLYIGSYGLTRLRVLTQVIMLWLCVTTVLVAVWLFVPKLAYMKSVLAAGLIIGAVVLWADVDTVVARHNVDAYLTGAMDQIDVDHLSTLNDAAVPYIARLTREAPDALVREQASDVLEHWYRIHGWMDVSEDFRGWTYVSQTAEPYLPEKDE